jgi:hypothetical protein
MLTQAGLISFFIVPATGDVMDISESFNIPCKIIGGIFWTAAYILIIRKGFGDKSYGMPFVALAFNLSWEIIFSFIFPPQPPQYYINIIWFLFDCIIVYQFVRFGKSDNEYDLPARWFYVFVASVFFLAFLHTLTMALELRDFIGKYSAFTMNLTMSVLYVVLYFRRKSLAGQSIAIAVCKMRGDALDPFYFFMVKERASFI